jgi:hypothetical protein
MTKYIEKRYSRRSRCNISTISSVQAKEENNINQNQEVFFLICISCFWCASCLSIGKGLYEICPSCKGKLESMRAGTINLLLYWCDKPSPLPFDLQMNLGDSNGLHTFIAEYTRIPTLYHNMISLSSHQYWAQYIPNALKGPWNKKNTIKQDLTIILCGLSYD